MYIVFPLFLHGETLFYKMGKHTVDHMQQGLIQCAQQNNQIRQMTYEFNKEFGSRKKGDMKPEMLSY